MTSITPRPSRTLLLAAASWAALAGVAAAQTPPRERAATLDDVIVTGTPFGVTDRASLLAVEVLNEEDLAVAPASTLGDLVNGLPGVRSTNFAPGASRPVIRGLSGPRVQVLTNGLGMIDASSVSPDHQVAVDPAEARRIEIVRGPSTLVFGGSAIGKSEMAGFPFNRDAGIIGDLLPRAGQRIEQRTFARIGVAREGNEGSRLGHQSGRDRRRCQLYGDGLRVRFANGYLHPSDLQRNGIVHAEHALVQFFDRNTFVDTERPETTTFAFGHGSPIDRHNFGILLQ